MALAPGTRLGAYEILTLLGSGGMGDVYQARDTRLGRDVAVKVLPSELSADPDRLVRFEREAHALAVLNHPNICTVYDVGAVPSTQTGASGYDLSLDGRRFLRAQPVESEHATEITVVLNWSGELKQRVPVK